MNLRYDRCLDYVWNSHHEEYVPYLYDEITKTGIPMHKIPIRTEVAEMVSRLIDEAKQKAMTAIAELKAKKEAVNFNSVHIKSGLTKNYLYKNEELRAVITKERDGARAYEQAWHNKYDRTSKSKDVIIATKDKYIAKLKSENQQLRKELN